MIRVKLLEPEIHRNETTFRYYGYNHHLFSEAGIQFIWGPNSSNDYDYAFVAQASIMDKKLSLSESIDKGMRFLLKVTGDYVIVDGQDSSTLMGTIDVFRESNAKLFLKTIYLKDFDLYKKGWANGRMYWGEGDYSVPDIDEMKHKMKLTGTNWGNTFFPQGNFNGKFLDYNKDKKYDLCGMFQFPLIEQVYEHELCQTPYYNKCRKPVYDFINSTKHSACKLKDGERLPLEQYIQNMYDSKIIFSPYGFGAYGAPRDVQAAQFGSVLIKPKLDWVDTTPNMYVDGETYIACKEDFSDLEEKVDYVLSNFEELQPYLTENFRSRLIDVYNPEHLVSHMCGVFKNLEEQR